MNHNYGYISTDMKIHEKLQNLFPWQPPAIKGNIPQGDMPGDQAQGIDAGQSELFVCQTFYCKRRKAQTAVWGIFIKEISSV